MRNETFYYVFNNQINISIIFLILLYVMNYMVLVKIMFLFAMSCFLSFFVSCSKGENSMEEEQSIQDEVIISTESSTYFSNGMDFESDAGSCSIYFTTNRDWNVIVSSANWCVAAPASGKSGENTFSVSVNENVNTTARKTLVTLVAGTVEKTISVSQEGAPLELILSDESDALFAKGLFCSADGDSHVVSFTVNCEWEVIVEGGDGWCSVNPRKGEKGNAMFTLVIGENADETIRSATVTLKAGSISRSLVVTQEGNKQSSGVTGGSEDYDEEQGTWDE